jgi:hypothetical protein
MEIHTYTKKSFILTNVPIELYNDMISIGGNLRPDLQQNKISNTNTYIFRNNRIFDVISYLNKKNSSNSPNSPNSFTVIVKSKSTNKHWNSKHVCYMLSILSLSVISIGMILYPWNSRINSQLLLLS